MSEPDHFNQKNQRLHIANGMFTSKPPSLWPEILLAVVLVMIGVGFGIWISA